MRLNCKYQKKCNSCHLYNLDYEQQLKLKNRQIRDMFSSICKVYPVIAAEQPLRYRNKAMIVFKETDDKNYVPGLYKSTTRSVMPCSDCKMHTQRQNEIASALAPLLKSFKIKPFDYHTRKGWLKSVLIREGFNSKEIMVVLTGNTEVFPGKPTFATALLKKCPCITTIITTVNNTDMLMVGKQVSVLFGKGYIEDTLLDRRFIMSADSFYQINPMQTEKLYTKAIELADIGQNDHVLDAYCGVGTIGIIASEKAADVISVEINKSSVENAKTNAKINNIRNITFIHGDVKDNLSSLSNLDIVFIDPPRAGCSRSFINDLARIAPKKIIYVSCNPKTQLRDLKLFKNHSYFPIFCQPVDMFPFTNHVETVCLLSKLSEAKNHISVKVDMDEMDVTAAESKATYHEIQDWVQEKYGFHVSHLNIAKTKRKCGIIERQNYNLPKSEESRSPETPEEKEEAIIEAFKAFQMIKP